MIISLALLSGCATSYTKENFFTGGFSDSQLAENVFRIDFAGNKYTKKQEH